MTGTLYGVGLGPGDPELVTVKAARLIGAADVVAYPRARGDGVARTIAAPHLRDGVIELPLTYPVTVEPAEDYEAQLRAFYDASAEEIAAHLDAGRDVVVLCEGDPFFYGSFMHLYTRLQTSTDIEVIAGIPGMAGCWNAVGRPIALGDDVMTVLMGTLPEKELEQRMRTSDALVIMKTGRNLAKVRRALAAAGRLGEAWLIERGTMPGERVARLSEVDAAECPYFAIVLVHGQGRRLESCE
jgi:precorrin-2/cobalt-factor-2 C20-methyltransferase